MFCIIPPTLAVAVFIFHGKLPGICKHVLIRPGGLHVMNNVVLTKLRIALSIKSECLRIIEEWFECYDHNK